MRTDLLLEVLHDTATAVRTALDEVTDWSLAGTRAGQHKSDIAADDAALSALDAAGVGILSEESGLHNGDRDVVVVVDPLDGSSNALHGIPWFATSLCAIDADGPAVAVVVNQANGERFEAVRGEGARKDGIAIKPTTTTQLSDALVALTGYPSRHLGWRQMRALGAAALDLCAVASGVVDAYIDCTPGWHGPWDYMGALLVCREAGALITDGNGEELVTVEWEARRMPIAAATPTLFEEVVAARRNAGSDFPAKNA